MAIRKIRVSNFKSFKDLEVELHNFNVLIGANASGKSNFIQIFAFLRDIRKFGLDNAISMQGGIEYLRNINIGSSEECRVKVIADGETGQDISWGVRDIGVKVHETSYEFAIKFTGEGPEFMIAEDKLVYKCEFVKVTKRAARIKEVGESVEGEISIFVANGETTLKISEGAPIKMEDMLPPFLIHAKQSQKSLLLERPPFFFPGFSFTEFKMVSIYDFDPKLPKKAVPITGKAELEEDGSNLAIVLKKIVEDKDKQRKFSNLMRDLLPFVADIDVDKFADKSLLFKLREIYSTGQYLPASLISDGTINIAALIIALYFEKKALTIIEEPERNIHPYLISKVANMMREASAQKQIMVTTHNPQLIKHVDLRDILLVCRTKEGFSCVTRPSEKEEIKSFLENDMGIEELYTQNLLELPV